MKPKTAAERKAEERKRKQEAGLVYLQEWAHQKDVERLRKFAAKLRKTRARSAA